MKINFKSKKMIVPAVILILLLVGGYYWKSRPKPPEFDSYPVTVGNIRNQVLSTGAVQPEHKLDIKPPINGRADTVLVNIGDKVKQGQVLAWMSSTDRAVLLDAARTKGPDVLAYWETMYKPAALVAPLEGTIISKNMVPGQVMTSSDVVFTMSDYLIVAANLDETDLSKIRLDQEVEMTLDAYPDTKFAGKVERIAYSSTTTNNVTTYEVDILPENTPEFMRSGMTVNTTFIIAKKRNTLLVPSTVIQQKNGKSMVLVPNPKNKYEPTEQPVEVGIVDGKRTEILSGLKEGDTVLSQKFQLTTKSQSTNPLIPSIPRRNRPQGAPPP